MHQGLRVDSRWKAGLRSACPEFVLAASAVRRPLAPQQVEAALTQVYDWKNFLAVVDKHRIAGLVMDGLAPCASLLPEHVLSGLRQRATQLALRSVACAREAGEMTRQLEQSGIPTAIVKGVTLSQLAYGDVKLRHCRDIDLLVMPENAVAAHAVLMRNGYELHEGDTPTEGSLHGYMQRSKHLTYRQRSSGIVAELHWRLYDNPFLGQKTYSPSTWQSVDVGNGIALRTLATQDLLLYLCWHGASHGWFRLKWLADVSALFQKHPECFDQLMDDARTFHLKRAVAQAVVLSNLVFGTAEFPAPVDWAERKLIQVGWNSLVRSHASTELYQERFASTAIRLSQLLLSFHPGYLWRQLQYEWLADENGLSRVTDSKRRVPLMRVASWCRRKLSRNVS